MKKLTVLLLSLTAMILVSFNTVTTVDSRHQINPVLGDISFVKKFGHLPGISTDEALRIQTHLEYVENMLRQKDVSCLSKEEQQKRNHLLDLLRNYRMAGIFPRNYDYPGRRIPCFIDKDRRICAVGYLVEQTAGRQAAEEINRGHKYETIFAMNDALVDEWIAGSGLTTEECAMIQPTYGWPQPEPEYSNNYISPANGIASAFFSGANLSLNTMNGIQMAKGRTSDAVPIIGLITGAGQIAFGALALPEERQDMYGDYNYTNESLKILCFINIGIGTSTMILSTCNLVADKNPKSKPTSWNIYSFPAKDNSAGLAFSLTHRF